MAVPTQQDTGTTAAKKFHDQETEAESQYSDSQPGISVVQQLLYAQVFGI